MTVMRCLRLTTARYHFLLWVNLLIQVQFIWAMYLLIRRGLQSHQDGDHMDNANHVTDYISQHWLLSSSQYPSHSTCSLHRVQHPYSTWDLWWSMCNHQGEAQLRCLWAVKLFLSIALVLCLKEGWNIFVLQYLDLAYIYYYYYVGEGQDASGRQQPYL